MKIGQLVRTELVYALENGYADPDEIKLLQTPDYSKDKFGILYPLLKKIASAKPLKEERRINGYYRYYAKMLTINNEYYVLCNDWYERPTNNDRPFLERWLSSHASRLN